MQRIWMDRLVQNHRTLLPPFARGGNRLDLHYQTGVLPKLSFRVLRELGLSVFVTPPTPPCKGGENSKIAGCFASGHLVCTALVAVLTFLIIPEPGKSQEKQGAHKPAVFPEPTQFETKPQSLRQDD